MTNYSHGQQAEQTAADYLVKHGYKILARNWRTRTCEIDIVAQKNKALYFVEVKYRQSDSQGHGTDYITPKKLKQMQYAAELWVQEHQWSGEYQLAAASIDSGTITFIDNVF